LLEVEWYPGRGEKYEEISGSSAPCAVGNQPTEHDREHHCDQGEHPTTDNEAANIIAQTENGGGCADGVEMERAIGVEAGIGEPTFRPLGDVPDLSFVRVRSRGRNPNVPPLKEEAEHQREQEKKECALTQHRIQQ